MVVIGVVVRVMMLLLGAYGRQRNPKLCQFYFTFPCPLRIRDWNFRIVFPAELISVLHLLHRLHPVQVKAQTLHSPLTDRQDSLQPIMCWYQNGQK